jgi:hypothetical protein
MSSRTTWAKVNETSSQKQNFKSSLYKILPYIIHNNNSILSLKNPLKSFDKLKPPQNHHKIFSKLKINAVDIV